jgi:hypothetical protein
MVPSRGINAEGSSDKIRTFIDICYKYNPIDISCLYPGSTTAKPKGFLKGHTLEELKEDVVDRTETIAVFSNTESVEMVLQELKNADLGISVVVSGEFDSVFSCCEKAGLTPHTVNIALGIMGKTDLLPKRKVLDIVTMCGHGLVSRYLVHDVVEKVSEGELTAEQAATRLGMNCVCGAFNSERAVEIIEEMVGKIKSEN